MKSNSFSFLKAEEIIINQERAFFPSKNQVPLEVIYRKHRSIWLQRARFHSDCGHLFCLSVTPFFLQIPHFPFIFFLDIVAFIFLFLPTLKI